MSGRPQYLNLLIVFQLVIANDIQTFFRQTDCIQLTFVRLIQAINARGLELT